MSEKRVFHNIINGEIQSSASGAMMDIVNPSTGRGVRVRTRSDARDVDLACKAAGAAFDRWRWTTPRERQRALLKLADVIEQNAEELVAIESENTGKPVALALSEEIPPMVDQIRFFAGAARVLEGGRRASTCEASPPRSGANRSARSAGGALELPDDDVGLEVRSGARRREHGGAQAVRHDAGLVDWMVEKMQDIFPPGVCNLVCGDRDTGAALTAHPIPQLGLDHRIHPGRHGRRDAAAADLKRAHLELGGKAPVVVFDDADIEPAVEGISVAGLFNGGQDCTAATRVLAQQGLYDEFVSELTEAAKNTKTGYDPRTRTSSTARSTTPTSSATFPGWSSARPTMPG